MQEIIDKLRQARSKTELMLLRGELDKRVKELETKQEKLNEKEASLGLDSIEVSKFVEFNSQSYASFYNTKLEKDKSVLTLSVAGLGFLITFTNFALNLGVVGYAVFLAAAICYLVCVYNVITIFEKNALYIVALTTDSGEEGEIELQLKKHDKLAIHSFYIGIFLSFVLGFSTSIQNQQKVNDMTDKNKQATSMNEVCLESFAGMTDCKKSFSGISSMKPQPSQLSQSSQNNSKTTSNSGKQNG